MSVRIVRFLVLGVLLAAGVSRIAGVCSRRAFTPFIAAAPPHRATADFDGDGQPDTARIDDNRSVSVHLSRSDHAESLLASVSALIQGDVDHDGDLDLIATTSSGEIVVWMNDGNGQFTRGAPSQSRNLGFAARLTSAETYRLAAQTETFAQFSPMGRVGYAVVSTRARPPTALNVPRRDLLVHGLRAPPSLV